MFKSKSTRTFTETFVKTVRSPEASPDGNVRQVDYWDALVPSFGLRVSSTGQRSWIVSVRILRDGKRVGTRVALGRWPEMSLAEARERAKTAKALAVQDTDPRDAARAERQARVDESKNTFGALADEFIAKYVDRSLAIDTGKEYRRALKGVDVADWQSRVITEITKRDVITLVDSIVARGARVWANRILAYLAKFFGWCADRDILTVIPTDRARPPTSEVKRERALTTDEIREVWAAFEALGGRFAVLFKLILLTGQRREEVAGMRWDELRGLHTDAPTWELPGERTKNGLPHVVPLTPGAVKLIRSLPRVRRSPFCFTTTGNTSVSGFSRVRARIDGLIAAERREAGIAKRMNKWVTHDIRRTVVTRMNEDLGILPHVVEAVVNHVSGAAKRGVAGGIL